MAKYRVIVLDDILATREGLVSVLKRVPGVEIGAVCDNSTALMEAVQTQPYDLAMLDLELGDQNGIELGRQLLKIKPDLKVIIYTKEASVIIAAEVFRHDYAKVAARPTNFNTGTLTLLATGSWRKRSDGGSLHGYLLLKNISPASFSASLRSLEQHGSVLDSEILDLLIERIKRHRLTPRETECSELISLGMSNREIAGQLCITQQAVENLINSLYNKLSIMGETKDPGRRVLLALTIQRWRGLNRSENLQVAMPLERRLA